MLKKLSNYLLLMRPQQWVKNLFVFAVLFATMAFSPEDILRSVAAFALFCVLASGVYAVNDVADLKRDRLHETKKFRPVAAGKISPVGALVFAFILLGVAMVGGFALSLQLGAVFACYVALMLSYSLFLKNIVILDTMIVAGGFVLRVIAGGAVLAIGISTWLLVCAFLLAMFLVLAKRRQEVCLMGDEAVEHRKTLGAYSVQFLDIQLIIITTAALISYALYTLNARTIELHGTDKLVYTLVFVFFGLFRYLYLIYQKGEGGDPTKVAIKDGPLIAAVIMWVISFWFIAYFKF